MKRATSIDLGFAIYADRWRNYTNSKNPSRRVSYFSHLLIAILVLLLRNKIKLTKSNKFINFIWRLPIRASEGKLSFKVSVRKANKGLSWVVHRFTDRGNKPIEHLYKRVRHIYGRRAAPLNGKWAKTEQWAQAAFFSPHSSEKV